MPNRSYRKHNMNPLVNWSHWFYSKCKPMKLLTRKMELESSSRPVWRSRPSLPFVSASHSKGKMLRHFKEKLCSAHWERALFYEIILDARLIFRSLLEVSVAASSWAEWTSCFYCSHIVNCCCVPSVCDANMNNTGASTLGDINGMYPLLKGPLPERERESSGQVSYRVEGERKQR